MNGQPHEPPYVILDSDTSQEKTFDAIGSVASLQVSWRIRIVFVLLSILSLLWLGGAIIGWAFSSLLYLLTMYKVDAFDTWMWRFWKGMHRAPIFAIGMLVAAFKPSLGMGFIILYFIFCEEGTLPIFQDLLGKLGK